MLNVKTGIQAYTNLISRFHEAKNPYHANCWGGCAL